MRTSRVAALAVAVAGLGVAAKPAGAAVIQWGQSVGGSYDDSNLWSPSRTPSTSDSIIFNTSGVTPYVISFPGNRTSAQLLVGKDKLTLDFRRAVFTIAASSSTGDSVQVALAKDQNGLVYFTDGTVNSGGAHIGYAPLSWGTVKLSNATWNSSGAIYAGAAGWGGLQIFDGGVLNSVSGGIGLGGIGGDLTMYGPGATWNISQNLSVGISTSPLAASNVQLLGGADLNVGGLLDIRKGGNVTLNGGRMDVQAIKRNGVLTFRAGTLAITGTNLAVDTGGLFGGNLTLGSQQNLIVNNSVTVASGSQLSVNDGQFTGGYTFNKGLISLGGTNGVIGGTLVSNYSRISGGGRIDAKVNNLAQGTINVPAGKQLRFTNTAANLGQILVGAGAKAAFSGPLVQNGILDLGDQSQAVFDGTVSGSGSFTGSGVITFNSVYNPGSGSANVSFGGDVVFAPQAHLQLEISGAESNDHIHAAGNVSLSNVDVSLAPGFKPNIGEVFELVTGNSINYDRFNPTLPALDSSSQFSLLQTPTSLQLSVIPVPEPSTLAVLAGAGAIALLARRKRRA